MDRRQFLKLSGAAAAAGTVSPALAETGPRDIPARVIRSGRIDMTIEPCWCPMIDGQMVYANFFKIKDTPIHQSIWVLEGEQIEIHLRNLDDREHAFAITGLGLDAQPIPARGGYRKYSFTAPPPGSYLFHDPHNFPVNRILGLNGAMIVLPTPGTKTPNGSPIPYAKDQWTEEVKLVFDAMGRGKFPGNQWVPYPSPKDPHHRDMVWLTSEMDSVLARRVADGHDVDGSMWESSFTPNYFFINGASGFDTSRHEELPDDKYAAAGMIEPEGYVGQPTMLRCINAGLCTHSLHIHGNDIFELTTTDPDSGAVVVNRNIYTLDVWAMPPMGRKDMLLPFQKPLDAPVWPPVQEKFPMRYVMHCHCEMSNTASGGNYPQGMVTHWELLGTYADYLAKGYSE